METPYGPIAASLSSDAPDPASWKVGDLVLGTYRIFRRHAGGSCEVFGLEWSRAVERSDGQVVFDSWEALNRMGPLFLAAKVPRIEFRVTSAQRQLFESECRLWASLGHLPHAVMAHGVRHIGEVPVLLTDWVSGMTLREACEQGVQRLRTPGVVLTWLLDFCQAMKAAQTRGLSAHGDVTPSNLLIDGNDRLIVTDFGLARLRWQAAREPHAGTPGYRSPEQARGDAPDMRSDLYSLARVMLAFIGGTGSIGRAQRPSAAGAEFRCLDTLLMKCLREAPTERFDSIDAFEEAVRPVHRKLLARAYSAAPARPEIEDGLLRAKLQYETGEPIRALEILARLPDSDSVRLLRASCHADLGQFDDALASVDSVGSSNREGRYVRATVLAKAGGFAQALREIDALLRVAPWHAPSLKLRVACLLELGEHESDAAARTKSLSEVIRSADQLLAQSPEAIELWIHKGWAHAHLGDAHAAEAAARLALQMDPRYAPAHALLAEGHRLRGELDAACESMSKACDLTRATAMRRDLLLRLGWLQFVGGRSEQTLQTCHRLAEFGDSAPADQLHARVLASLGRDLPLAASLLERALASMPDDVDSIVSLGQVQLRLGRLAHARHAFERALRADPDNIGALLGRLQVAFDDWHRIGGTRIDHPRMCELGQRFRALTPGHPAVARVHASLIHYSLRGDPVTALEGRHVGIARQGAEAVRAWRAVHPEEHLELSNAVLRGANLKRADLRDADCTGADLRGSDLREADLRGARLIGALLNGAFADDAKFEGADLSYAELQEASLRRASLRKASLNNAHLVGIRLCDEEGLSADLTGADLTGVLLRRQDESALTGGYLELACASGLAEARLGPEVRAYLTDVMHNCKCPAIADTDSPERVRAAIKGAEEALGRT